MSEAGSLDFSKALGRNLRGRGAKFPPDLFVRGEDFAFPLSSPNIATEFQQ
jgi:hypothetical protein